MRTKTLVFFSPFDFQNGGRRMKILHVILTAFCDILLAKAFKFCVTEHNEDCCLGLRHDSTNRNGAVI